MVLCRHPDALPDYASPRLDKRGNGVRGLRACVDLAEELGLHTFGVMKPGSAFLKAVV